MNPMNRKNKRAFTIVELLTVMSIITILISLLVPGLNRVRKFAINVRQKAQFHSIEVGLDMFYTDTEMEEYPESNALDSQGEEYCGAMKLAEAMMGQDMLGFHPDSVFRHDGYDATGEDIYPSSTAVTPEEYTINLRSRMKVGLQLENANAYRIGNIYGQPYAPFDGEELVLCDVYTKNVHKGFTANVSGNTYVGTGKKIGMPILYYKAHESRTIHDPNDVGGDVNRCIYNYEDNDDLVSLGMPWQLTYEHPINGNGGPTSAGGIASRDEFYAMILNKSISNSSDPLAQRPYKSDSYILISAGFDGEYGTRDDIFNFDQ